MQDDRYGELLEKLKRCCSRIEDRMLETALPFRAVYSPSKKAVPFDRRLNGSYTPAIQGDVWGHAWDSAWFHLQARIPKEWEGREVVARLDLSGEGLVYSPHGDILQGISGMSIFDPAFKRSILPLYEKAHGGESVDLWVEAAANDLFGIHREPDPDEDSPRRYGYFDATVNQMELCIFNRGMWHLMLDFRTAEGLVMHLTDQSPGRGSILECVNEAIITCMENPHDYRAPREMLSKVLKRKTAPTDLSVTAVGHAHIDTAWLWPVRETIRKCARTFANQIGLIEKYPEYVFGASQAQHYDFVRKHYPVLYEKIRKAFREGRWEVQGGMWVEADCNLISGESMIRQILHGKNFFLNEFGIDVDNLWLPDAFGFSAAMPQILKKSGIDFFLTQKLSWNESNVFPHHTFLWRGIDGSEVIAHFPPENNYNSPLDPHSILSAAERFREKELIGRFLSLFGTGDGGGGPTEEHIEQGRRMADLEGVPEVRFGQARDFFHDLNRYRKELPVWNGELYLELHRGTYTSQARVKKANRCLENSLRAIEMLWSCAPLEHYPSREISDIWEKTLLNQFHDILPGSSITEVYTTTHREHAEALRACRTLLERIAPVLFDRDETALTLFNPHSFRFEGPLILPVDWLNYAIEIDGGPDVVVQQEKEYAVAALKLEPLSFLTLRRTGKGGKRGEEKNSLILENDLIRYEFDREGALIRVFDREYGREVLQSGSRGNLLTLYEDRPQNWDAWDIDISYEDSPLESPQVHDISPVTCGPVRQRIQFRLSIGKSTMIQEVSLARLSRRLDFRTFVDWAETHKMLRVSFPVNVHAAHACFDIQYGYIKRSTGRSSSLERAQFEVPAHRYADLSAEDYGVALLNDCKYGYKVLHNILDLNLLRSPAYPDPDADRGRHEFTYSLLPHPGGLVNSPVMQEAAILNREIPFFPGWNAGAREFPVATDGRDISLEVVKKAEKENCIVLRLVEIAGKASKARLSLKTKGLNLVETDLLEWNDGRVVSCETPVDLQMKPFEIRTFKVK
jgi:alpha-mannosidase